MKQNKLTSIIFITGCLTRTAAGIGNEPVPENPELPNIIMIMADDLGWGDVGFNGNTEVKTLCLDRMANEGIQFTRFYTAAPLSSPTRASILTGRHPFRTGILSAHTAGLRVAETTLAEVCQNNGYTTGFFGKWHMGWVEPEEISGRGFYSPPWYHGFDESFATRSAVPTWNPTQTPSNFGQWGNKPGEPWGGSVYVENGKKVTENLEGDDSRIIMDRVIPFINKAEQSGKSFFACIWFHTPHEPVIAGPEYLKMYEGLEPEMKRHYYGCITAMDEQIGRLREELKKRGLDKNTIIWFCSDNGPADPMVKIGVGSAGPFRGHKHMVYEGGLRVPSLLIWPGKAEAGKKVTTLAGTVDYFPTIVEMANLKVIKSSSLHLDGISLLESITGNEMSRDTTLFAGWKRLYGDIDDMTLIGNRFKLVIHLESEKPELYDLINDPYEKKDVSTQFPDIAAQMFKELIKWDESCRLSRDGKDYDW